MICLRLLVSRCTCSSDTHLNRSEKDMDARQSAMADLMKRKVLQGKLSDCPLQIRTCVQRYLCTEQLPTTMSVEVLLVYKGGLSMREVTCSGFGPKIPYKVLAVLFSPMLMDCSRYGFWELAQAEEYGGTCSLLCLL